MDQMPRLPRMEASIEQLQNALPLPTLNPQNPAEVAMLLSLQHRPSFYPIYHPMEPTPPWISDGQNALQSAFPYSMGTFPPQLITAGSIGNFELRGTPTPPVPPPGLRKPKAIRPETTATSAQNTSSMATMSVPVFGPSVHHQISPVCTVASVQIGNASQVMSEVRTLAPQQGVVRAIPSTTDDFDLPILETTQNDGSRRIFQGIASVQSLPPGAYPNPYAPQESSNRSNVNQDQSFDLPVSSVQLKPNKKKKEKKNPSIPLPPVIEDPRQPIERTESSATTVSTVTAAAAQLKISAPSTVPAPKKVPKYVYIPLAESSLCKDMPELEPEEPLLPQQMRRPAPRGRPKNVLTERNESRSETPSTNWSNEAAEPSVCCSSPGRGLSPVRTRKTRAKSPTVDLAPIEEVEIEDIPHYVNGKIQKKRTQLVKDRREPIPIKAGCFKQISKPKTQNHLNWVKYPSQRRMILLRYGLITIPSKIVLNAAGISAKKAGRRRKTIKGKGAPMQNFIRETNFRQKAEMVLLENRFLPNMENAIFETSWNSLFEADMEFTTEVRDVLRDLIITTAVEVDFPFGMPGKNPPKKANRLTYTKSRSSNRVATQEKKNYKIT